MSKYRKEANDLLIDTYAYSDAPQQQEVPEDKGNLIYLSMLLLGCGLLFPFNAMLTASDYFEHIWPDKGLASFVPLLCNLFSPFIQIFMVLFSHYIPHNLRAIGGFSIYSLAVISVPIVAEMIQNKDTSYYIALAFLILIGISNAFLSSTIFSFGAVFPPKYSQAIMAGNGWSGVIVCGLRILSKLFFNEDDAGFRASAFLFFGSATFTTIMCIFAYIYITKSAFAQYYLKETPAQGSPNGQDDIQYQLMDTEHENSQVSMWAVCVKLFPMLLNLFMVFVMCFIVFPGAFLSTGSTISWITKSWYAVVMISIFNVFDLVGRSLPSYVILFSAKTLPYAVFSRFLLYPLFILYGPSHLYENTWVMIGTLIIFSITNGYYSTLCFIHYGQYVNESERSIGGGLMSVALTLGITTGSLLYTAIDKIAFN